MAIALYTKPRCSLCRTMRQVVADVLEREGEPWVEVDISLDPALFDRLGTEVPLLVVDGAPTFRYFVTERALLRVLHERRPGDGHCTAH